MQIEQFLQMIGAVPIVGVEERHPVETEADRVERSDSPRRRSKVMVRTGQNEVFQGPRLDFCRGESVRHHNMRAWHVLGAHAEMACRKCRESFTIIGGDDSDVHDRRRTGAMETLYDASCIVRRVT